MTDALAAPAWFAADGALADADAAMVRARAEVWRLFGGVPRPVHRRGCPCCAGRVDLGRLLGSPREELTGADLDDYVAKALTTVGDTAEWVWLTPRVLELLVDGGLAVDDEIVLGKFGLAQVATWAGALPRAVVGVLAAELQRRLRALAATTAGSDDEAAAWRTLDAWLCGLAVAFDGPSGGAAVGALDGVLSPGAVGLRRWLSCLGRAADRSLAGAVVRLRAVVVARGPRTAFWRDAPGAHAALVAWAGAHELLDEEPGLFALWAAPDGGLELRVDVELGGGAVTTVTRAWAPADAEAVWRGTHEHTRALAEQIADDARRR